MSLCQVLSEFIEVRTRCVLVPAVLPTSTHLGNGRYVPLSVVTIIHRARCVLEPAVLPTATYLGIVRYVTVSVVLPEMTHSDGCPCISFYLNWHNTVDVKWVLGSARFVIFYPNISYTVHCVLNTVICLLTKWSFWMLQWNSTESEPFIVQTHVYLEICLAVHSKKDRKKKRNWTKRRLLSMNIYGHKNIKTHLNKHQHTHRLNMATRSANTHTYTLNPFHRHTHTCSLHSYDPHTHAHTHTHVDTYTHISPLRSLS